MTTKEAQARLQTFGHPYPPCDAPDCAATAGTMIGLGDPEQGTALCTQHMRRWLDARYAAMGMPFTAAERVRRERDGVVV